MCRQEGNRLTTRQYNFTIIEVDNFVGGDGHVKKKAMLVNGRELMLLMAENGWDCALVG